MKIGIIGANGQLGQDIVKAFQENGDEVVGFDHSQIEISNSTSVTAALDQQKFDVIINTAAMHHVDNCELDPVNAFAINGLGCRNLAEESNRQDFLLLHVSTDYVFDGTKGSPYLETDAPNPLNVYGNTKLSGEYFVRSIADKHHVVRVSGIYGHAPCRAKGQNFVELMLRLSKERDEVRVVNDEEISPTSTVDIAKHIVALSSCNKYDLYHFTARESCTWYEFAKAIFELADVDVKLSIADPTEFPAKVPRPKYSVLENQNLRSIGLDEFLNWKEGLKDYLKHRV